MEIIRLTGSAVGRNRAVAFGDLVFTVATAGDAGDDLKAQAAASLATIDRNLAELGSDKSRIVQATVYLREIRRKAGFDEVWNPWIGPDPSAWPQRACIGVALAGDDQVEIVVIAAR